MMADLRGAISYARFRSKGICVPVQAVIEYRGERWWLALYLVPHEAAFIAAAMAVLCTCRLPVHCDAPVAAAGREACVRVG